MWGRRVLGLAVALLAMPYAAHAQAPDQIIGESIREQSCRTLAGGTVNAPDSVRADPSGGLPATWQLAPAGLLPAHVYLRTRTESFNRIYEFALRAGALYARRREGSDPWRQVPLPPCIDGRLKGIAADDDEMVGLDGGSRIFTMDNALKDATLWNWSSRWGPPTWTGPGYALPADVAAWSWSVISPVEDQTWTDPAGNHPAVGTFKVSHIWGLRTGGQRLTFWDPWLPLDDSYEMCGPERGRFKAVNLSASGSHVFVIGARGDMFTRLYDFDVSGLDPVFFKYSYANQRGKGDGAPIQLPAEGWTAQPKIPGQITSAISISKFGTGAVHALLRVEGRRGGAGGYWERDIASPRSAGWSFHPTGQAPTGRRLANSAKDTSATGLGAAEDHRYVMRRDGITAVLEDYNPYCSPARLTVTRDGQTRHETLHNVDGLRQQVRARGLDDTPRQQSGAIEYPKGTFEETTLEATRSAVTLDKPGWTLRREDLPAAPRCLARRVRVRRDRVGRVELGMKRRSLDRRLPAPGRRTRRIRRWCVKGGGSVTAVLSRGRVVFVVTTAPGHRARRGPTVVVKRRRGKVRYVAVAPRRTIRRPRLLRLRLRQSGVLRNGA